MTDTAIWTQEDVAPDADLAAQARRALGSVRPSGYVLAVHAPGRLALVWSDLEVPREGNRQIKEKFGPSIRAIGQPIIDGQQPAWWPATDGIPSPLVRLTEQVRDDGGMRLYARCTACGAMTYYDAVPNAPSVRNINWPMLAKFIEARFDGRTLDIQALPEAQQEEVVAFSGDMLPMWREEMRHNDGCTHV